MGYEVWGIGYRVWGMGYRGYKVWGKTHHFLLSLLLPHLHTTYTIPPQKPRYTTYPIPYPNTLP